SVQAPIERIITYLVHPVIPKRTGEACAVILDEAIEDSYKRLIEPSVERDIRNRLTDEADAQAIEIFSEYLQNLLLQAPLKEKMIVALDPAFRTGCTLAVLDETGKMHEISVIYPTAPRNAYKESEKIVLEFIKKYNIELIAIGNGTAS